VGGRDRLQFRMSKEEKINATTLLSAIAMQAKKAQDYPAEAYVVDLSEVRQIIRDLLEDVA